VGCRLQVAVPRARAKGLAQALESRLELRRRGPAARQVFASTPQRRLGRLVGQARCARPPHGPPKPPLWCHSLGDLTRRAGAGRLVSVRLASLASPPQNRLAPAPDLQARFNETGEGLDRQGRLAALAAPAGQAPRPIFGWLLSPRGPSTSRVKGIFPYPTGPGPSDPNPNPGQVLEDKGRPSGPAGLRPAPCLQAPPQVGDGAPTGRSRWGKGSWGFRSGASGESRVR